MKRARFLTLLAAALLPACTAIPSGPGATDLLYEADQSTYTADESIVSRLVNASGRDVGYNLCAASLEKRIGGGWVRVQRNPEQPCVLPLYTLHPGETATYQEPASRVPGPGTYRLNTRIETPVSGRAMQIVTEPFTVQ